MAILNDVISMSRLRQAIGGVGDTDDVLLTAYRDSAIRWVENWTSRKIVDVAGWRTDETDFDYISVPDIICFSVSDVKEGDLVVHYRNAEDDPTGSTDQTMTIASTEDRVKIDRDGVYIYYEGSGSWGGTMRFTHPIPTLVCNRGMERTDIPPPFIDAIALIVRALYDGTAYDNLGKMSVLSMLLKPYTIGMNERSIR